MRRAPVLVILVIINVMTLMLIAGHGPWAGRVIWGLDRDHGLNIGDLPVLAMWLVGCLCCARLLLGRRPD